MRELDPKLISPLAVRFARHWEDNVPVSAEDAVQAMRIDSETTTLVASPLPSNLKCHPSLKPPPGPVIEPPPGLEGFAPDFARARLPPRFVACTNPADWLAEGAELLERQEAEEAEGAALLERQEADGAESLERQEAEEAEGAALLERQEADGVEVLERQEAEQAEGAELRERHKADGAELLERQEAEEAEESAAECQETRQVSLGSHCSQALRRFGLPCPDSDPSVVDGRSRIRPWRDREGAIADAEAQKRKEGEANLRAEADAIKEVDTAKSEIEPCPEPTGREVDQSHASNSSSQQDRKAPASDAWTAWRQKEASVTSTAESPPWRKKEASVKSTAESPLWRKKEASVTSMAESPPWRQRHHRTSEHQETAKTKSLPIGMGPPVDEVPSASTSSSKKVVRDRDQWTSGLSSIKAVGYQYQLDPKDELLRTYLSGRWVGDKGETYEINASTLRCIRTGSDGSIDRFKLEWLEEERAVKWGATYMLYADELKESTEYPVWHSLKRKGISFCWTREKETGRGWHHAWEKETGSGWNEAKETNTDRGWYWRKTQKA